ncbi:hypothetical protein SEPCBS119000_000677 [Sporothrix epigloea]|uniref:Nucleolar complex-associated protein 3 n=1 Tax=Sporothrix epigloea TaxID=1892477 RepID=A0ABP0D7G9_9PEZI
MASRELKRRRVGPPRAGGDDGPNGIDKSFMKNAASWSLEENYAERSLKRSKKAARAEKVSDRLPIRTADGVMRPSTNGAVEDVPASDAESDSPFGDDSDDDEKNAAAAKKNSIKDDSGDKKAAARIQAQKRLPERQQIQNAKEELAKLALKLNENPEENSASFKLLAQVSQQYTSITVQKMCLATQLAVYKDVIPGYRIRAFGEEAVPGERLSSDVRRIRAYEQSLLAGYQGFLRELMRLSKLRPSQASHKGSTDGKQAKDARNVNSLADAALSCACSLLTSVPHFNFREDLLKIIAGKLSMRRVDASFVKCRAALETLFREDDEGRPSMEAVAMLAKMMKARDYWVDESVPNTFLHLRLLSEFSGKGSQDSVDRASDGSAKKNKKEFRTKRQRKMMKEQKALDRDMAQADALVAHEERDRMQSETLKLVFATYFRILKLRTPHLMGAVLEGLAKYAHLINQNFFGDLLEALKDLIRYSGEDATRGAGGTDGDNQEGDAASGGNEDDEADFAVARNPSREALLCTVTAYALLAGQDAHNAASDLHLDLSFFTTNLFGSLYPLALSPDIEKRANSLQQRLADAQEAASSAAAAEAAALSQKHGAKVNLQTTTVLLIRCLTAVLLPHYNIRSVPPLRLAAFTKQIMSASLHVPEKSSQALLALLYDVAHTHSKKIGALWNTEERKGDGTFNPLSETAEASNPFAATVWEGELLRKHYCPKVREGIKALEKNVTI